MARRRARGRPRVITTNPRHRFMLQAYYRHRFLEIAGRYDEIFVPEMTVENPVYHVHASGQHTKLEGRDASRICTVCGLTPTRPFSTSKTSRWWLQTTTSPPPPSTTSRFQEGRSCSTKRQAAGSNCDYLMSA